MVEKIWQAGVDMCYNDDIEDVAFVTILGTIVASPVVELWQKLRPQCHEMYEKAFGGKITCLMTYRDANDPAYMPLLREEQKDYIYHAELVIDNQRIIMSNQVDIELTVCYTDYLTIIYDTKEEVQRAYEIMKEGSKTIFK